MPLCQETAPKAKAKAKGKAKAKAKAGDLPEMTDKNRVWSMVSIKVETNNGKRIARL